MNQRQSRHAPSRAPVSPLHRGPQAIPQVAPAPYQHAPNAALLIDFDNVTMGIRSDLAGELRNLLGSEIIKGKVAVQRAYADWRRYPQYIVPLAESSIDMIMAPAYGTSKKNATDIRLSVDAMELVFTRPEIGTYILLSGDSDFASLVTKLKEYGKYVIGVGIRESSSDLLVMNCDEYYSYNALAGLVKAGEEEVVKWDPWELVTEAINRMVKNGDVMRSDRLKQVMQDIDPGFDEKNLGMSKFSKFCQEAASQGLINVTKLENGQLEVSPPDESRGAAATAAAAGARRVGPGAARFPNGQDREDRGGRHGRRGRGRGREERGGVTSASMPLATPMAAPTAAAPPPAPPVSPAAITPAPPAPPATQGVISPVAAAPITPAPTTSQATTAPADAIGRGGVRLTREEAFELVRRAAASLDSGGGVPAQALRARAFELLGRDSESLSERHFTTVLRDAHDAEIIDLRRRGDDYEVSLPVQVAPVAEQLNRAAAAHAPSPATPAASARPAPRGMGPRGIAGRGRPGARPSAPPPELLAIGVVEETPAAPTAEAAPVGESAAEPRTRGRGRRAGREKGETATRGVPASPGGATAAPVGGGTESGGGDAPKGGRRRSRAKKGAPREAAA